MFVEVIIALMLLSITATALLNLQANVLNQVWRENENLRHLWQLQNQFSEPEKQSIILAKDPQSRVLEQPNIYGFQTLKYAVLPLNQKSELYGKFPDLYMLQSSGVWLDRGQPVTEMLASFIHLPPKVEERK